MSVSGYLTLVPVLLLVNARLRICSNSSLRQPVTEGGLVQAAVVADASAPMRFVVRTENSHPHQPPNQSIDPQTLDAHCLRGLLHDLDDAGTAPRVMARPRNRSCPDPQLGVHLVALGGERVLQDGHARGHLRRPVLLLGPALPEPARPGPLAAATRHPPPPRGALRRPARQATQTSLAQAPAGPP